MAKLPNIVPISELRQHAAALIRGLKESKEPVVISQRGRAAAVLLSVEEYERTQQEQELLEILTRGEKKAAAGREHSSTAVPTKRDNHDLLVARSRALHRAVAEKIRNNKDLIDIARSNLERWIVQEEKHGRVSPGLLEWRRRFEEHGVEEILDFLCAESETADQLRHATPFCGILTEEERNSIYRQYAAVPA